MFVGRINKAYPDVSRFTVDLSEWLDDGETVTNILTHTITLGTTGWSNFPYPLPGDPPPYDPTPLLYTEVKLMDGGTAVEVYVSFGTPGNVYTCQFEVAGTTLREVTFEVAVQISGQPPFVPPFVDQPVPPDASNPGALSLLGGTMQGPLYLYRDPTYPTEASTKQYVDFAISLQQDKVNRSGDSMSGFLSLYADPVQPLHAATKNYVDVQTGSTLHDAPNDTSYYGRHALSWAKVTEEAPTNVYGYLRSNSAWIRGVPSVGATLVDVRVTDGNSANTPCLTGIQTPFSAGTDLFNLAARRATTGALGDGGVVQLHGPSLAASPNAVSVFAGTRAAAKLWNFLQDGSLNAPGLVEAAGTIRSTTGRVMSKTIDAAGLPSVVAWNQGNNVASGFWVGPTGTIRLGQADGNGLPVTTWVSISSTGIDTATLSTSANAAIGTSLNVGTSLAVGTGITAQSLTLTGTLSAANLTTTGDLTVNKVTAALVSSTQIKGDTVEAVGDVTAGVNVVSRGSVLADGALFASGQNMVIGNGGSGRIMQFTPNWYWDFHLDNGRLDFIKNGTPFWVMDQSNQNFCYNNIGFVGGHGDYANLDCSAHLKTDIADASQGLAQVLRLMPKTYRRLAQPDRTELGFVIEDVRYVIPEAILSLELDGPGSLTRAITTTPILAAAVNAIKELHLRLQALESLRP